MMTPGEFRAIRVTLALTQAELGELLGFGRMHITKIEAGEREITRPVELVMLALADGWHYTPHVITRRRSMAPQR